MKTCQMQHPRPPPVSICLPGPRRSAEINSTISTFCYAASLSFSPSVTRTHGHTCAHTNTYARHPACEIKVVNVASAVWPCCV